MHACPLGFALAGYHGSQNIFLCAQLFVVGAGAPPPPPPPPAPRRATDEPFALPNDIVLNEDGDVLVLPFNVPPEIRALLTFTDEGDCDGLVRVYGRPRIAVNPGDRKATLIPPPDPGERRGEDIGWECWGIDPGDIETDSLVCPERANVLRVLRPRTGDEVYWACVVRP
jgi:hypothetical protein